MLPSMTTSKSFRATMLPSSLSFPSFRSNSNPSHDSEKSHRKTLWHKGTRHLPRGRPVAVRDLTEPKPATATTSSPTATESSVERRATSASPEQLSRDFQLQKSHTWGARVSSLIPVLTPDAVDTHPQAIHRKPLAVKMSPPQTPPPPPPYVASEADDEASSPRTKPASLEVMENNMADFHLQDSPPRAEIRGVPPIPQSEPPEIPEFEFSFSTHQTPEILAPIPPSPEIHRATLTKQQPVKQPEARRTSGTDSENETSKQSKLQKDNRKSRPRSSSLFQPKLSEPQQGNVHPQQTSPIPEPRGRRSISAQTSLAPSGSGTLAPNSRSASSHDGSQSPTRGKLRRSWLPGGGRSRSNSEANSGAKSEAWVLSEETHAEYNPSFLRNGEKVFQAKLFIPNFAPFEHIPNLPVGARTVE